MGELLKEFGDLLEAEVPETTFEEDSNKLIEEAKRFISNSSKYPDCTYQGIAVGNVCKCIALDETDVAPWKHVSFTIDFEYVKDINNGKLEELSIPTFAEEVRGTGDKLGEQFGFNQNIRSNVKSIKIPECTTIISPNTFAFQKRLEKIVFDKESKLVYLGDYAFAYCENLNTLDLRDCKQLDEIKENTFFNSGIKHLKISSNVKRMYPILNTEIQYVTVDKQKYSIIDFNSQLDETGEVFWYTSTADQFNF